ncbi:MAG: hypothetical protein PHO26_04575 [Dehalococcoidia bacterium]|nr:hypothetical protein [Dehalococcoidia bacterium]MDD5494641.1 hypothetical protein [Dehalococcoidia bacterium]
MKYNIFYLSLILTFYMGINTACVNREYTITENYTDTEYRTEFTTEKYSENVTIEVDDTAFEYELKPLFSWSSTLLSFKDIAYIRYCAYDIPDLQQYEGARLKVAVWEQLQYEKMIIRVFDMTSTGHIYAPDAYNAEAGAIEGSSDRPWITGKSSATWLDSANSIINGAKFLGGRTNIWSNSDNPHILEYEIGKARNIAFIISGPLNPWNANVTASLLLNRTQIKNQVVTRERNASIEVPYEVQKQRNLSVVKQVPIWDLLFSR